MANWDEETLNEVINQKHGESEKGKPKTAIVSENAGGSKTVPCFHWFTSLPQSKLAYQF